MNSTIEDAFREWFAGRDVSLTLQEAFTAGYLAAMADLEKIDEGTDNATDT